VVGNVIKIAHKINRLLISSNITSKERIRKKAVQKIKSTRSQTGYERKGCPQCKKFRVTGNIVFDIELFIGGEKNP
jgi:hypothetical protein